MIVKFIKTREISGKKYIYEMVYIKNKKRKIYKYTTCVKTNIWKS